MITEADAESRGAKHCEEERHLEPIDTVAPEVERDRGQRQKEGADQERTGGPVDAMARDAEDGRLDT